MQKKSGDEYEDKRKRKGRTKRQDYSVFVHWQFLYGHSPIGNFHDSVAPPPDQYLVRLCAVCSRTSYIIAREYQPAGLAPAILFRTISFEF